MSDDMKARARSEAERRWADGPEWHTPSTALRDGFVAGAEWQHAQDAETIAALRVKIERLESGIHKAIKEGTSFLTEARIVGEHARRFKARAEAAEAEVATLRAKAEHLDAKCSDLEERNGVLSLQVAAVGALADKWVALAEAQRSAYKALFADTLRGNADAIRAALANPQTEDVNTQP